MGEFWTVEFSLLMQDVIKSDTPSVDGEMLIRGSNIFEVLEKAKRRLFGFDYDRVIIHAVWRDGFEKGGSNQNDCL